MTRRVSRRVFGSVERLGSGRWRARYTGPDGRPRSAPVTFATRAEADGWLAGVHADLLRGLWVAPERAAVTLAEYWTTWRRQRTVDLRPRTLALYDDLATRWVLPRVGTDRHAVQLGVVPLSALTVPLVREWWSQVVATTHAGAVARAARPTAGTHPARAWALAQGMAVGRTGRLPAEVLTAWAAAGRPCPTSPAPEVPRAAGRTVAAQAYRLLHAVLSQAADDGIVQANPCRVAGAGHVEHPERMPLAPAEVAALAVALPARYRAAALLAAWSGLRPGEVFALTPTDLDLHAGTVTVRHTLTEVPGAPPSLGPPKTTAARRTVALPAFVTDALVDHLRTYPPATRNALVFTTANGAPVTARARSAVLSRARATIGRPDVTWHHLRHTGATLAAQVGATTAELQHRIGHTTTRAAAIYQHAPAHRDHALAAALHTLATTTPTLLTLRTA